MIHPPLHHQSRPKIKRSNVLWGVIVMVSVLYPLSPIFAALSCSVTTQALCTGSDVTLLRMSGSTNAHAELPSQSNANYASNVVCCSSTSAIGNSCSGNFAIFGRLSAVTNAHMQETSVNTYGSNACLSDTSPGDVLTIAYQNTNCIGYDTTLLSMSASDNATIGDGSAYTKKVCATVTPQIIVFDIDTAADFHNGESSAPYSVPLGALTTSSVTHSDDTAIRMIVLEGDTNASGGMVITVMNANGANGLKSTSVPADKIPNATTTMVAGTANYGLCVATSGLTGFSRATGYSSDACSLASGTNGTRALSSGATDILNSGGTTLVGGHAEVVVNAAISTVTPAHNDYTDTLTFVATGTF